MKQAILYWCKLHTNDDMIAPVAIGYLLYAI